MPSYPGGVGLMMGMPWDGKPVCLPWSFAWHQTLASPPMNYDMRMHMIKGKPVAEAREDMLDQAIKWKVRYLFFHGCDTSGPAHGLRQLIFHMENLKEKGFAVGGGIYVQKAPPCMPMVFRGNGIGPYMDWKVGEVFEVSGIGMDWTVINVEMVKDLPRPWFKTVENIEKFKDGINQGEHWTEDLFFCQKVTDAGLRVFADGGLLCDHWDNLTATPYRMDPNSKPLKQLQPPKGAKRIVDLGCGSEEDSYHTTEGHVTRVDIRDEVKPDYRCDLRVLPFRTGEFDVAYSSHTLEHFKRTEVSDIIDEWMRVLKPEGELRLVLPNIEWAARQILNGEVDGDVMNVLYGAQSYHENYHKMGFTSKMLEQLLAQKGFKYFLWNFEGYHMMCRSWKEKPKDIDNFKGQLDGSHIEVVETVPADQMKDLKEVHESTPYEIAWNKRNEKDPAAKSPNEVEVPQNDCQKSSSGLDVNAINDNGGVGNKAGINSDTSNSKLADNTNGANAPVLCAGDV